MNPRTRRLRRLRRKDARPKRGTLVEVRLDSFYACPFPTTGSGYVGIVTRVIRR